MSNVAPPSIGPRRFRLRDGLLGAVLFHQALLLGLMLIWHPVTQPPEGAFPGPRPLKLVFAPLGPPPEQEPTPEPDQQPRAASRLPEPKRPRPTPQPLKAVPPQNRERSTLAVGRSGAAGEASQPRTGTEGIEKAPYRVGQRPAERTAAQLGSGSQAPEPTEKGSTGPSPSLPFTQTAKSVAQASAPLEMDAPATEDAEPEVAPETESAEQRLWRESMRAGETAAGEPGSEATLDGKGEPVTAEAAEPATAALAGPPTSGPAVTGTGKQGTGEYAILKQGGYKKRGKAWP